MKPSLRRGNVKWFSNRQKPAKGRRRHHRSPMQLVALRMRDLSTLFRSRWGVELPDDDSGRDDLKIAINHLACLAHPRGPIANWIDIWAPWLTAGERKEIVPPILANPQRWKADALAWKLRLMKEERAMLGITTIGACDEGKAARTKRRRAADRQRKENARRAEGMKPRKVYEGQSVSATKPWIAEGISRATWYRRQARETAPQRETSPATA